MEQQEIAEKAGIHPATLSRYLNGKARPKRVTAVRLEKITGIQLQKWMTGDADTLKCDVKRWLYSKSKKA